MMTWAATRERRRRRRGQRRGQLPGRGSPSSRRQLQLNPLRLPSHEEEDQQ
jgi:hypothetical protein